MARKSPLDSATGGDRTLCSIRLQAHAWPRRRLAYEATGQVRGQPRVIKRSPPLRCADGSGAYIQALIALVEELRREGWEPLPYAGALPRGVISVYTRPAGLAPATFATPVQPLGPPGPLPAG
ncbi:MAG TPA: hypothetical protein VFE42_24815 [Chloroflexota bacterium]|nr:hypothetical protein [Chloroflexota bacterium]